MFTEFRFQTMRLDETFFADTRKRDRQMFISTNPLV